MALYRYMPVVLLFVVSSVLADDKYHNFRESWGSIGENSMQAMNDNDDGILQVTLQKVEGIIQFTFRHHFNPNKDVKCGKYSINSGKEYVETTEVSINNQKFKAYTVCSEHNGDKIGAYAYYSYLDEMPERILNSFVSLKGLKIKLLTSDFTITTNGFENLFNEKFKGIYEFPSSSKIVDQEGKPVVRHDGFPYKGKSFIGFMKNQQHGRSQLHGRGFLKDTFMKPKVNFTDAHSNLTVTVFEDEIYFHFVEPLNEMSCNAKSVFPKIYFNDKPLRPASVCDEKKGTFTYALITSNEAHPIIEAFKNEDTIKVDSPYNTFYFDTSNFIEFYSKIESDKVTPYSPLKLECEIDFDGDKLLKVLEVDLIGQSVNEELAFIKDETIKWSTERFTMKISRYSGKVSYLSDKGYAANGTCKKLKDRLF